MKTGEKALAGVGLAIPVGYIIWETTRRKNGVRIDRVGIEAAGELPLERPWNAITVAAAPLTGEINAAWVRVGARSYPHTQFPVSLERNTRVTARVRGRNTSGRTVRLQFIVQLRDPTGRLRSSGVIVENFPHNVQVLVETSPAIPLDVDGTWVINAILREI